MTIESPEIRRITALLSDPARTEDPCTFPMDDAVAGHAGLYSWWADSTAKELLQQIPGSVPPPHLIYVGQAGATSWPSGKRSTATLKSRILNNHIGGNASSSTFRLTITALLVDPLNLRVAKPGRLVSEDNRRVSAWIKEYLRIAIVPLEERDSLQEIEHVVLKTLDPPLNLDGRPVTSLRQRLTKLRREITQPQMVEPGQEARDERSPPGRGRGLSGGTPVAGEHARAVHSPADPIKLRAQEDAKMTYCIHVNRPTKQAIAHPCTCSEVPEPEERTEHEKNFWIEMRCRDGVDQMIKLFKESGYNEARWHKCR